MSDPTGPTVNTPTPAAPVGEKKSNPAKLVGIILAVVLVVGGLAVVGLQATGAFSTEIKAEPISSVGANPFGPPVGEGVTTALPPLAGAVPASIVGNQVGLYGGTQNNKACDANQLVSYLTSNPDKAAAWASVLGITVAGIPDYVSKLTPAILRTDTAVTNHGFKNGKATSLNSVLQAGSAVMVDSAGVPRVRCKCGNPLTEAKRFTKSKYTGEKWSTFSPNSITVIQSSPSPITQFTLADVNSPTGTQFTVPAGSAVTATAANPTTSTTAAPGATTTAAPNSPTTAAPTNTTAGSSNGSSIDGKKYSGNLKLEDCVGFNDGSCSSKDNVAFNINFTCASTTQCTTGTGRTYKFDNGEWLTEYPAPDANRYTCDGVAVPTTVTIRFSTDANAGIHGTYEQTADPVQPSCPNGFLVRQRFDVGAS